MAGLVRLFAKLAYEQAERQSVASVRWEYVPRRALKYTRPMEIMHR